MIAAISTQRCPITSSQTSRRPEPRAISASEPVSHSASSLSSPSSSVLWEETQAVVVIVIVEATIRFPLMRIMKLGRVTTEKQSEHKGEMSQN